jgi:hypothetical protein
VKIYVASSWRNPFQPDVVLALRLAGHQIYDFRNPPERAGFQWRDVGIEDAPTSAPELNRALDHPEARAAFATDFNGMLDADACVLLLPCNRSAHLEAGWFAGQSRRLVVMIPDRETPELMYKLADQVVGTIPELLETLEGPTPIPVYTGTGKWVGRERVGRS